MQDSIPFPINPGGKGTRGRTTETALERAKKIEKLTRGKDPFSSYVPEHPEDEDVISEDDK